MPCRGTRLELSFIHSFFQHFQYLLYCRYHSYRKSQGGPALDLTLKGCRGEGALQASLEGRVEFGRGKFGRAGAGEHEAGNVHRWNWTCFLGQGSIGCGPTTGRAGKAGAGISHYYHQRYVIMSRSDCSLCSRPCAKCVHSIESPAQRGRCPSGPDGFRELR